MVLITLSHLPSLINVLVLLPAMAWFEILSCVESKNPPIFSPQPHCGLLGFLTVESPMIYKVGLSEKIKEESNSKLIIAAKILFNVNIFDISILIFDPACRQAGFYF
jgi:hypothetical protein